MKVLFVTGTLGPGGRERQSIELLKGLTARDDVESEMVLLSKKIHYGYVKDLPVTIHCLERKIKKDPTVFPRLWNVARKFRPDIIHCWEDMCVLYAIPVAKHLGAKLVNATIRRALPDGQSPGSRFAWSRLTYNFSDVIVANSRAGLDTYQPPREKSRIVHSGFDFSRVEDLESRDSVRERLDIRTPFVVGMVAGFEPRKDYDTYLHAAMRMVRQRDDVTFLAVGGGTTLEACQRMVSSDAHDRILFPGQQERVETLVNIFDVGVLLTNASVHGEGISNAIMEYMALGKPVVASRGGGTAEIVTHEKSGFLVESGSVEETAQAIQRLLAHPDLAQAMGGVGRDRIRNDFSLEQMTEAFMKIYRACLS